MEPLIVYSVKSCNSSNKAKKWLEDKNIDYIDRNTRQSPITVNELIELLKLLPNGLNDIFSRRSSVAQKLDIDLEECSLSEVLKLMESSPSLIKKPIIRKGRKIAIGFSEESMRVFIPRKQRKAERKDILQLSAARTLI